MRKKIPGMMISISIVEDNPYLRNAWKAILAEVEDFVLLGDYASCEDAFKADDIGASDVILMDIGLPGMSGIDGVEYLTRKFPGIAIVMITVHDDDQHVFDAICAGAVGYLLKSTTPEVLIQAIRDAKAGGSPMTPNIARKVIGSFQRRSVKSAEKFEILTGREQEVLQQLSEGKSYQAIADVLFLSVHGVRYHLRHIYEKLQVNSRSEAVAKGLKRRWIQPPR